MSRLFSTFLHPQRCVFSLFLIRNINTRTLFKSKLSFCIERFRFFFHFIDNNKKPSTKAFICWCVYQFSLARASLITRNYKKVHSIFSFLSVFAIRKVCCCNQNGINLRDFSGFLVVFPFILLLCYLNIPSHVCSASRSCILTTPFCYFTSFSPINTSNGFFSLSFSLARFLLRFNEKFHRFS